MSQARSKETGIERMGQAHKIMSGCVSSERFPYTSSSNSSQSRRAPQTPAVDPVGSETRCVGCDTEIVTSISAPSLKSERFYWFNPALFVIRFDGFEHKSSLQHHSTLFRGDLARVRFRPRKDITPGFLICVWNVAGRSNSQSIIHLTICVDRAGRRY